MSGPYGLTPTGFIVKPYEQILADVEARQRATLGALNLIPTSLLRRLNTSYAAEIALAWELLQEIYDAHDPDSATGISADHNGALAGITRLRARKSRVTLRLVLRPHTTVLAGSVVSVRGNPAARFETLSDAINLKDAAVREVPAQALDFGEVEADTGTIEQIDSPSAGWDSVTNLAAAVRGAGVETDELYRIRRVKELSSQGGSTAAGVLADVRFCQRFRLGMRRGSGRPWRCARTASR